MLNPIYNAPSFSNLYKTLGITINDVRPALDELNWELEQYRAIEKEHNLQSNSLFQTLVLCDEILLGINYSAIDLCATLRANLCCSSQYENLYYTKLIYANIQECYKFLYYFKGTNRGTQKRAFLYKLQQSLSELVFSQFNTELEAITIDLLAFAESNLRKKELRDITYHYNQSIEFVYDQTISANLDDILKKVCNPFLALTERIRKFVIQLKLTINCLLTKPLINGKYERIGKPLVSEVITQVAENLNRKENFVPLLERFIEQASKNVDGFYSQKIRFNKAAEHLLKVTQVKSLPKVAGEIQELASAQMQIYFMGGDLACALRNYIIAESSFEKEFFLSRIYITKDATLEHFYGFNPGQKEISLWKSICAMIPSNDENLIKESIELGNKFENFCKEDPERDILAHVADKGINQVPAILNTLGDIKLLKNLRTVYDLVTLFNAVSKFLDSLLKSMNRVQKEETNRTKQEMKKQLDDILELVKKAPMQSDAKTEFIKTIEDSNAQLMQLFDMKSNFKKITKISPRTHAALLQECL